jgi:dolichol-phosphate mannosyltransferase
LLQNKGLPPEFTVVIPALNEEQIIGDLLRRIDAALAGRNFDIIVVDDGSDDDTAAQVLAGPSHWRVIQHDVRGGQSAAIHTGVLSACSELIVTLDADGQNPPEEIPKLLAAWSENQGKVDLGLVAGQRVKRQDRRAKVWASRAANLIRGAALKDGTRDTGCGLKVFPREVFLSLPYFDHMHRFLPALVVRSGLTVLHVDVAHAPRQAGVSKYTNFQRALVGAVDLIGVMWLIRRKKATHGRELQKTTAKLSKVQ